MIERICQGLNELGAAKYAQAVVRDVLSNVVCTANRDSNNSSEILPRVSSILRSAASATLHDNGFLATAEFTRRLADLRPKDSPVADVIDALTGGLRLAAAQRAQRSQK